MIQSIDDPEILKQAQKILHENMRKEDLNWKAKIVEFDNIQLLDVVTYTIGISKNEFLKRLINVKPFYKGQKSLESFENLYNASIIKLNDDKLIDVEKRVEEMNNIRQILVVPDFKKDLLKHFKENCYVVSSAFLKCLCDESKYLVSETCYTVCLMLKLLEKETPLVFLMAVVKGCLDAISQRLEEQSEFLSNLKSLKLKHEDMEIYAGKELPFNYRKYQCFQKCREHLAISCSFYTLCFIFHYNDYYRLYIFLQTRILYRREYFRWLFIDFYFFIVKLIDKNHFLKSKAWQKLPAFLYYDIARALREKNSQIKGRIVEIMNYFMEISIFHICPIPVKYFHSYGTILPNQFETDVKNRSSLPNETLHGKTASKSTGEGTEGEEEEEIEEEDINEGEMPIFQENIRYQRNSEILPAYVPSTALMSKLKEGEIRFKKNK